MKELRRLVIQFVAREIDYPQFRRSMVEQFLSIRGDGAVENAAVEIDIACADFSLGNISDEELKRKIVLAVQRSGSSTTTFVGSSVFVFDLPPDNSIQIQTSWGIGFPTSTTGTFASRFPMANGPVNWPAEHKTAAA